MAKLALRGGEPVEKDIKIPKWPIYNEQDETALLDVLRSRRWCRLYEGSYEGSVGEEFEQKFADYHGAKYGVAVANGTVAIQLALRTLGVGERDEVLVPPCTFIGTASAVSEVGAIPIFVDVDPQTYQIDPGQVEKNITKRTKGLIAVHYAGYPADLDSLLPLVEKHKLFLIEDCCQAHGTEWEGRKVGTRGDMGCFSFQVAKSLTSGEGGFVLTNRKDLAEKAKLIHDFGRAVGRPAYEQNILSSNYRLSEFQAALLLSGMSRLEEQTNYKDRNGKFLKQQLKEIEGIQTLKEDRRITKRGYFVFILRYNESKFEGISRDRFLKALRAEGIPAETVYEIPLYRQPAFRKDNLKKVFPNKYDSFPDYKNLRLPVMEKISAYEQIRLHHAVLLAEKKELQKITQAIVKIKENIDELRNP